VDRGLPVDRFAPRISFFFNAHNDFLEEIAKFRAARRLWARLMAERFHPKDPNSLKLRFHAQTAGSTLTAQQPHNNIARVAIQAMAAVLGGCQSLHTNSFDEAISLPSEEAATTALRVQQILAHESGAAMTVDPVGGAPAIEAETDRIERESRREIEAIDALGGATRAIEAGYQAKAIERSAYEAQLKIERGEQIIVGVNRFGDPDELARPIFTLDPKLEREQAERVRAFKAARDGALASHAIGRVEESARRDLNLMSAVIDAVKAGATLGEISDALRRVYRTYDPNA
jgi:methylmalonyl-CoA mutase N-terminal domain/subunit